MASQDQHVVLPQTMSAQAFCLRRNNHSSDMSEHFEHMFKEESMVDVTLSCGDGSIRAHKMVLSACSSYFKNIFSKFVNPYQYPVVILKDIPFADLRAIVEFIYRGEVFVPQEQLASVLKSAESLKVKGLSEVNVTKSQTNQQCKPTKQGPIEWPPIKESTSDKLNLTELTSKSVGKINHVTGTNCVER